MKFSDIRIGTRLGLLAGLLLFALLLVGLQDWHMLAQDNAQTATALQRAATFEAAVDTARMAQVEFKEQVQEWKDLLLRGNDQTAFDKYRAAFNTRSDATQADLQSLKSLFQKLGLDTDQVDQALATHSELQVRYLDAVKQYDVTNPNSAHLVDGLVKGMDRAPTAKIDSIVAYVRDQSKLSMAATTEATAANYRKASLISLLLVALAVAGGAVITYWLTLSITRPLVRAVHFARSVASGNLRAQIEASGKDETGQLLQALQDMNHSLIKIVGEVRDGTDTIARSTSEIAAGNLDLSSRTEQQASSLSQTASAMQELIGTVKQNAEHSGQANRLASTASQIAIEGKAVVSAVVEKMGSINQSSRKIVDIIAVIDGIAFQTNILALNAAVEAARAGEQGRGFAVVASEVRNLAQRSASAAKEIKALIGDSVEKVEDGSRLVDQAGATMDKVVESVTRVSEIITGIALASEEQSRGIEQVNLAIAQMDQVTQQNAALVEEAAAAADSMQNQATVLANVVSVFKLA